MRLLNSLLLTLYCLLSFLSAADSTTVLKDGDGAAMVMSARNHEVYTMGFEVETHGIKIEHNNQNEILVILESYDGKWQLTSDTHDDLIDSTNWVNLECRTVGGLTQAEINKLAHTTYKLISEIKVMCDLASDGRWSIDFIKAHSLWGSFVKWKLSFDRVITFSTKKQTKANSGVWNHIDFDLRPQLTFSMPLSKIGELYKKIFCVPAHKDTARPPFLDSVPVEERDPWKGMSLDEVLDHKIAKGLKLGPYRAKAHNIFLQTRITEYFFATSEFTVADGLFWLLCGYVYDVFFQNIMKEAMRDTGPKGFIKVVSRVPFNKMYDQMPIEEQSKFQGLFTTYFNGFRNLKVKPYFRDPNSQCYEQSHENLGLIKDEERITLGEWFDSILIPVERANGISRDLMSPPRHTDTKYSMGAVEIEAIPQMHALLENRGYKISKTEIIDGFEKPISFNKQLDTFARLIENESEKFFQLHEIGETR